MKTAPYLEPVFQAYQDQARWRQKEAIQPKVKVNQALSSLALVYEKIRTAVDFRAEHLFRRVAIERILRRHLLAGKRQDEQLAQELIKELIWSRYLQNESVPVKKVGLVAQIIAKYRSLKERVLGRKNGVFDRQAELLLGLMATEIDELLVDQRQDEAWVWALAQWFQERFEWQDPLPPEEQAILLYIALRQAFLKSDETIIRYHLLLHRFPNWSQANQTLVDQVASEFESWQKEVEAYLHHPLSRRLFRFVQAEVTPFFVLRELIEANWPQSLVWLEDGEQLKTKIEEICRRRYQQIGQKVRRGIIRSIIYIFATKMIFAFFLEIPYELWAWRRIAWLPLGINLVFPPSLMFFVGLLIRPPGEENTKRIIDRIRVFLYPPTEQESISLQFSSQHQAKFIFVFRLLYLVLFLLSFGGVAWLLWRLGFNLLGGMIFFFFVSLVLLFGFRVRWAANELRVTGEREHLLGSLFNLISLPFLDLGGRLSVGLSRLNVLMFVLDFLIEAPLKIIIDLIGEWTNFIRQKQAEVVEVPF